MAETVLAANGSEPADDLPDAERPAQESIDDKGVAMEPAIGLEPMTC